jgi:6-pyruvoyltetrahydropterin/6-carboxytetrahydropterin synthase
MRIRVSNIFEFESAHKIRDYEGKCSNLHGHNYKIVVTFEGNELQNNNILIDFNEIKAFILPFIKKLDHQYLNEVFNEENVTAEFIAIKILEYLKKINFQNKVKVYSVKVYETDKSWVEVINDE